jgi:hypothetical protein
MKTNTLMDSNLASLDGLDVALFVVAPTQTTNGTKCSDANYADVVAVAYDPATDGPLAGTRQMANTSDLEFGATGYAIEQTIVGIGIVSGANTLYFEEYDTPEVVAAGDIFRLLAGDFIVREG